MPLTDTVLFILTLFATAGAIRLGMRLPSKSGRFRRTALIAAAVCFGVGTLDRLFGIVTPLTALFWRVGGSGWLSLAACLLFLSYGAATRPNRAQRATIWFLAGIISLCLLSAGGSSFYWLMRGMKACTGKPGPQGMLKQSSPFTCAPAAAAMMLYREGVDVSEGEMAYWSGTNLMLGSSMYGVYLGLRQRLAGTNLRPHYRRCSEEDALLINRPFVAALNMPDTGPHAVLVSKREGSGISVADPYSGRHKSCSEPELKRWWLREIVYLSVQRGPVGTTERRRSL